MKKQSFISSVVLIITAIFIIASTNLVFAADVASLINKGTTKNELGEDISIADVNCTSASAEPRVILSKVGERDWCSRDMPDVCSRTKLGAAKKVCHFTFSEQLEEYRNQLATPNQIVAPAPAPEPVVSESVTGNTEEQVAVDKVELEKERISIEQQKLQIRRQELELNKRQLELERQAVTTD